MSVLQGPAIHFRGSISWDPGLANNSRELFDPAAVEVRFPPGTNNDNFVRHVLERIDDYGIWNYYGTHTCRFEPGTAVTGGRHSSGNPQAGDELVHRPVSMRGKLVDLDPRAVWNSQIFFNELTVGDEQVGVTCRRFVRPHSRWINFRRILERLPIAGSAGVVWQTVFPTDHLQFRGLDRSPLLASLADTVANGASGLMVRFATYGTLYFQNGIQNSSGNRPRNVTELAQLHLDGEIFSNPAYSRLIGSVGVWTEGEPLTWPGGRYLVPDARIRAGIAGVAPFQVGPAVAEYDAGGNRLVFDFLHTIPEVNRGGDKADLGWLTVAVQSPTDLQPLARISPDAYGRNAYEANCGIVDVPLPAGDWVPSSLAMGDLVVLADFEGDRVSILVEQALVATADERDVYFTADRPAIIQLRIFNRGVPATEGSVAVARYEGLQYTGDEPLIAQIDEHGTATIELQHSKPSVADYGLFPTTGTPRIPAPGLDITSGSFISTRTLPSDAELNASTSDEELTWEFVFNRILRNWHLLNPVMSAPSIQLPLDDEALMTQLARRIAEVIDESEWQSFEYMPVTRDLSEGKRKLLKRWAQLQDD